MSSLLYPRVLRTLLSLCLCLGINAAIGAPDVRALGWAETDLGFRLVRKLSKESPNKNILISPVCLGTPLLLLRNGAAGETEKELAGILKFPDLQDANISAQSGRRELLKTDSLSTFEMANSLWLSRTVPLKTDFVTTAKTFYDAEIKSVDLANKSAVQEMKEWVQRNTHGKINDVELPSYTEGLRLLSAVYFKANWHDPFEPANTHPYKFTCSDGSQKTVQGMNQTAKFDYLQTDQFQALVLPYQGNWKLYVFLPRTNSTLADFQSHLTLENWEQWLSQFKPTNCAVIFPKFSLKCRSGLQKPFQALGLKTAFTSSANFEKLSDTPMFVTMLEQQSTIEMTEEGTEAASVTLGGVSWGPAEWNPPPPIPFTVNRPFFIALEEKQYGHILFMSSVSDPAE